MDWWVMLISLLVKNILFTNLVFWRPRRFYSSLCCWTTASRAVRSLVAGVAGKWQERNRAIQFNWSRQTRVFIAPLPGFCMIIKPFLTAQQFLKIFFYLFGFICALTGKIKSDDWNFTLKFEETFAQIQVPRASAFLPDGHFPRCWDAFARCPVLTDFGDGSPIHWIPLVQLPWKECCLAVNPVGCCLAIIARRLGIHRFKHRYNALWCSLSVSW